MSDAEKATYDDVNSAFRSNGVLIDTDERLVQYLRVLCSEQIRSDENRLLANNRCITINTILTQRFMERMDRVTTRYTWIVIILAVASLAAAVVQIWVSLK
jgi:hypothetical protein